MRIANSWRTERLIIRKTVLDDCKELSHICNTWTEKELVEGERFSEGYIENCFNKGDFPPIEKANISDYYIMTIEKIDGRIIGFFDLYHGYPKSDSIWISMFIIDNEFQGNAYGQEVIKSICEICREFGWKSIGLGVYLKNWKGLRFWNKNGFDKIIGIYGDKEYSQNTFSVIGLKQELI
jgi:RimJ/RimL family protein N-acetyltransferase